MVRITDKKIEVSISPQEWMLLINLTFKLRKRFFAPTSPSFSFTDLIPKEEHVEGMVSNFGTAMTTIVDLVAGWRQSSLGDLPPPARAQRHNYYEAIRVTGRDALQKILDNRDSPLEMMEELAKMHSNMQHIYVSSGLNHQALDGPRQVEEVSEEALEK